MSAYLGSHLLTSVFIVFIILSLSRILFMAVMASKQHRWEKKYGLKYFWKPDGTECAKSEHYCSCI